LLIANNTFAGQVFGGDVLRFFHGDECLALPEAGSDNLFELVSKFQPIIELFTWLRKKLTNYFVVFIFRWYSANHMAVYISLLWLTTTWVT